MTVVAMVCSKHTGPIPLAGGSASGQDPCCLLGDKGKAKVIEQTKKWMRQHWVVERVLAVVVAYNKGVRGGSSGALHIGSSSTKT